jgi:diguanylate cyclase (GGDEF)-like protein
MLRRFVWFLVLVALPGVAMGARGEGTTLVLAGYGVLLAAWAAFVLREPGEVRALVRAAADREREIAARREELQRRIDFLSAQREIALVLNEDVDFQAILERVLSITCDTLGGDAELWMLREGSLELRAARTGGKTEFDLSRAADRRVRQCLESGQVVLEAEEGRFHALSPLQADREIVGVVRISSLMEENPVAREQRTRLLEQQLPEFSKFLALALKTPDLYTRAVQDGLTGLWTKRHFMTQARDLIEASRRYGEPLSLIMVDVDHFKKVNDTHGHQAGDQVLKGVAEILKKRVRGGMAFRYGGEEMAVLLPKSESAAAAQVAERLRAAIDARKIGGVKVTASFGVAGLDGAMAGWEALVERADRALYRAKESGRNRVVAAEPAGDLPATRRVTRSA